VDHLVTAAVYGNCETGPHPTGAPAHIFGLKIFCAECCPGCNHNFSGEIDGRPVEGEQIGLF
jgi:hypothetical protein